MNNHIRDIALLCLLLSFSNLATSKNRISDDESRTNRRLFNRQENNGSKDEMQPQKIKVGNLEGETIEGNVLDIEVEGNITNTRIQALAVRLRVNSGTIKGLDVQTGTFDVKLADSQVHQANLRVDEGRKSKLAPWAELLTSAGFSTNFSTFDGGEGSHDQLMIEGADEVKIAEMTRGKMIKTRSIFIRKGVSFSFFQGRGDMQISSDGYADSIEIQCKKGMAKFSGNVKDLNFWSYSGSLEIGGSAEDVILKSVESAKIKIKDIAKRVIVQSGKQPWVSGSGRDQIFANFGSVDRVELQGKVEELKVNGNSNEFILNGELIDPHKNFQNY